jgi:hypothetical protein
MLFIWLYEYEQTISPSDEALLAVMIPAQGTNRRPKNSMIGKELLRTVLTN